ncbi:MULTISPECIES: ABC transporter permease [Enterococcus]|uniref:ABC transporter permease n=1 Tax=Enterococcus TaxID=1350 RepID=UPI0010F8495F|nr:MULTISPECIES: tetronasin resistance protein [Enterococcus]KAF1304966.1 tetronasin resistance protein [Enterococcus sp. JM9B]
MNEKFARWGVLFVQYLKRDWKKIIFWVLGIGLFSGAYVPAFEEIAKGQGAAGMFETMQNPAMISMVGPTPITNGADYTIGAMYAHEMLLFCGLFAMIISALHVVGHTRKEEDLGLTELVRSFRVGRQANSLAVLAETILINLLMAVVISGAMISFGVDSITTTGAILFGLSIAFSGVLGAVIALVMAQIMPTSSGATGASLGIVGLLYIVRAGTDVSNLDLSAFNPMSWTYLTYPFTENNWLPLLWGLLFILVMVLLAFALEGGRDMNAGYLPEREGRATAKKSLLSVHGLFIKLNKGVTISWLIAFVIMGAAYGSIYGDMQTFLESNDLMKQMFAATGASIEESFTGTIMIVLTGLATILPVAIINKLFAEEVRLHLSQLYSTKITRGQLYWTTIALALIASVIGVLLSAGSLGGTALAAMGDGASMDMGDFLAAGFNFYPAVLFCAGLAALALGWAPKVGKLIYAYLAYSFMLNYFGGILDLPDWFMKTAIQSWIPQMPLEKFDAPTFLTITAISLVLILLGYVGYKKRDMVEGA